MLTGTTATRKMTTTVLIRLKGTVWKVVASGSIMVETDGFGVGRGWVGVGVGEGAGGVVGAG